MDYGWLTINGSQPASPVVISVMAGLGGTGTVGHITANSTVSAGLSPGLLTCSNVTFQALARYHVELNGTAPGSGYDQLKVRGAVALSNVMLYAALAFPSAISNSYIIIDNDGTDPVISKFTGLVEGATVNVSGTPFRITCAGGMGNEVVLTQLTDMQQPLLRIAPAGGTNVVIWWPTNFYGYTLVANTNLNTNVWAVVSPAPAIVGTNNCVTNPASGTQKYHHLRTPWAESRQA